MDESTSTAASTTGPLLNFTAGALMGSADAVPGVSGGTIALILGVYERLIENIGTILALPRHIRSSEGRRSTLRALRFLVPLGLGVLAAYYVATKLLVGPADEPGWIRKLPTAPLCYAFFFGLVLASLVEPWQRIRNVDAMCYLFALLAGVVAAVFVTLPHATTTPSNFALLYGGALAIGVMLLPGISGSLLLLILGQYTTVAGSIHDREWHILGIFLLGVVLGLLLFVPVLRALLRRYHDRTMAALTGLMAGSLLALWPWKDNYEIKQAQMNNVGPGEDVVWVVLAAVAGAGCAWGLRLIERRINAASDPARATGSA